MRNKLVLAASILFSISVNAQDIPSNQVPSVVKNAFNRSFPSATGVDWEKDGNLYNAEFDLSRIDYEVWIDSKGVIVKQKKELTRSQLPANVLTAVKKGYPAYRIDDVDQYTEGKQVFYKVELEQSGHDIHVVFDQKGKVTEKRF